jgi:hypothetical protein
MNMSVPPRLATDSALGGFDPLLTQSRRAPHTEQVDTGNMPNSIQPTVQQNPTRFGQHPTLLVSQSKLRHDMAIANAKKPPGHVLPPLPPRNPNLPVPKRPMALLHISHFVN